MHLHTAERFLMLLKTKGPLSAAAVAQSLGITHEGARLQLQKLAAAGLVQAETAASRGVGRPVQSWQLTAAGHTRFPDAHADLSIQLIQTIQQLLGDEALQQVMNAREKLAADKYMEQLAGIDDIPARLEQFAAIRSREGFLAEWQAHGDAYLFIENHCPICSAAKECPGICESELRIFQQIMGGLATIARKHHIVGGDRRCVYEVAPLAVTA
ncbi:transcriptional regulator [Chitinophaga costaii]|uniref:Transcriptional regulator n=2 Tax=Chitinophaga costaii TaxID=1335309 RepID=A0A1C4CSI2_9BACT|nr:transcriptional regulator [Chitinophaga costaii]SCC22033.1 transcriptional regulator [Chitinophaga costaii]